MRRVVPIAFCAVFGLAACAGPSAPEDRGVCWRVDNVSGKTSFVAVGRGVENLETCAVLLEGLNLQGHPTTTGAYQGYFVFIGADAIRSAPSLHGMRYPVFQPPQRAAIDRDLRKILKTHGGQLPDASDLSVERP